MNVSKPVRTSFAEKVVSETFSLATLGVIVPGAIWMKSKSDNKKKTIPLDADIFTPKSPNQMSTN